MFPHSLLGTEPASSRRSTRTKAPSCCNRKMGARRQITSPAQSETRTHHRGRQGAARIEGIPPRSLRSPSRTGTQPLLYAHSMSVPVSPTNQTASLGSMPLGSSASATGAGSGLSMRCVACPDKTAESSDQPMLLGLAPQQSAGLVADHPEKNTVVAEPLEQFTAARQRAQPSRWIARKTSR